MISDAAVMSNRQKRPPGRPKGSGEIESRLSIGFPAHLLEMIESRAAKEGKSRANIVRDALEAIHQRVSGVLPPQINVTIAPRDLEDLQRAVRNGIVPDLDHAAYEAIRRYLDWIPGAMKKREET